MRVALYLIATLVFLLVPTGCEEECKRPARCSLDPDPGPCYAYARRYYYDFASRRCKEFTWGGCDGVVPFNTLQECQACECNQ
jgi:hypothetical protein